MDLQFNKLEEDYPIASKEDLFDQMGGDWPSLKEDRNYGNTCSIRLSIALKKQATIPKAYREAIEGDGTPIILKVATMERFLRNLLGRSYWGMSKSPGVDLANHDLPSDSGIIVYHANWTDATGHFDLWTGSSFVGTGDFDDVRDGYDLEFWKVD